MRIGEFAHPYGVDQDGFICTEVDLTKIQTPFKQIIDEIKNELLNIFEKVIHSIYLYGSVATGKARLCTSDIDLLFVFESKPTSEIQQRVKAFQQNISARYCHIVRGVGISRTDIEEIKSDRYGWGCFLKHLCVCIAGKDLTRNLPRCRPSKDVARAFNGNIETYIKTTLDKLETISSQSEIDELCRGTMRKIVRTGFCLVMEQERSWTTDLKTSYRVFSAYYPEQSQYMSRAYAMAQSPISDKELLREFLQEFGGWLSNEMGKL